MVNAYFNRWFSYVPSDGDQVPAPRRGLAIGDLVGFPDHHRFGNLYCTTMGDFLGRKLRDWDSYHCKPPRLKDTSYGKTA